MGISLVAVIAVLMFFRVESETQEVPAWLDGTLLVSTLGSEKLLDSDAFPTDQYLCAFDFSNQTTMTIKVPTHARLMEYKKTPKIVYRGNECFGNNCFYIISEIIESPDGQALQLQTTYDDIETVSLKRNPLVIYGIDGEGALEFGGSGYRVIYYLSYGISGDGELEYQLLRESTFGELDVIQHYPLSYYIFSNIYASVSSDGKLAWRELSADGASQVFVFDGEEVLRLEDGQQCARAICWLDADRLLYTADVTDMRDFQWGSEVVVVPRIWHINTGEIEDLNSTWNNGEVVFSHSLESIAVARDGRYFAAYVRPTEDDSDPTAYIVVVSLTDGQNFVFAPWNRQLEHEGVSWGTSAYRESNDGIILYDPGADFDLQLAWYE